MAPQAAHHQAGAQAVEDRREHVARLRVRAQPVRGAGRQQLLAGLARALRQQGYAVDTAADGEDGLHKAMSTDYDALVLDVMLPKLDGWEVLARIRLSKATPVLLLTARDRTADRVRGLDAGADDYLIKPFDNTELFARLRAIIRRRTGQPRAILKIGEVRIDTASRTVTRAGEAVPEEGVVAEVLPRVRVRQDGERMRPAWNSHFMPA